MKVCCKICASRFTNAGGELTIGLSVRNVRDGNYGVFKVLSPRNESDFSLILGNGCWEVLKT